MKSVMIEIKANDVVQFVANTTQSFRICLKARRKRNLVLVKEILEHGIEENFQLFCRCAIVFEHPTAMLVKPLSDIFCRQTTAGQSMKVVSLLEVNRVFDQKRSQMANLMICNVLSQIFSLILFTH